MRRYDVTDWFSTKVQLQMAQEAGMSQAMADLEFKVRPQCCAQNAHFCPSLDRLSD